MISNLVLVADLNCKNSSIYLRQILKFSVQLRGIIFIDSSKSVIPKLKVNNFWEFIRAIYFIHSRILRHLRFVSLVNKSKKHKINYNLLVGVNYYDSEVINLMLSYSDCAFLYTCGGIVPSKIFNLNLKVIHTHLGLVPKYRGSDCMSYQMLIDNHIGASIFYMSTNLDSGDIIARMTMPIVDLRRLKIKFNFIKYLNKNFDPIIRATFLAMVLAKYKGTDFRSLPSEPQLLSPQLDFLFIHPKLFGIINKIIEPQSLKLNHHVNICDLMNVVLS